MGRLKCLFCGKFVREPEDLDIIYDCVCGACYSICAREDEIEAITELAEKILGEEVLLLGKNNIIEIRKISSYDVLLDYRKEKKEMGMKISLIFGKKIPYLKEGKK